MIAKTDRIGPFIYYRLSDPGLMDVLDDLSPIVCFLELKAEEKSESNRRRRPEKLRK
jgi:hypothetical protein